MNPDSLSVNKNTMLTPDTSINENPFTLIERNNTKEQDDQMMPTLHDSSNSMGGFLNKSQSGMAVVERYD